MNACPNCGEDVGDATMCPSCGRRQYRYATDDATNTASEFKEADRSEELDEVAELLRERIQPSTPPRSATPKWTPPRRWDQGHELRNEPQIQGTQSAGRGVGCLLTFFLFGFVAFWIFLVVGTVTEPSGDAGASVAGGVVLSVIPLLIIISLFRRMRRGR